MRHILVILVLLMPVRVAADWEPPPNPNPTMILDEAKADTRAGRFEDALAKHLWFHHHALEYERSLYGVRLSFALSDWQDLAKAYPPALEKLKETRDDAAEQVLEHKDDMRDVFHGMSAINKKLGEVGKTVTVFIRLDQEGHDVAKRVYSIAQPALVKCKQFALCGKYLEPERSFAYMVDLYDLDIELADEGGAVARFRRERQAAEDFFLHRAATLMALLVLNERKPEAEKIAERVRGKSKHAKCDAVIDSALEGKLPKFITW